MKIGVIGTGYVGLPTGVGFAELGNSIICCDKMIEKVEQLNAGKITLYEEGLEELFNKNINKNIVFTTSLEKCVKESDIIIIAVGTPPHPITKEADMKYIFAAAEEIASSLTEYKLIAIKSTVPVGTGDQVEAIIKEKTNVSFDLISLPEFLREGFAVRDFFHPDRVICGTNNEKCKEVIRELYKPISDNILFTNRRSSELIKYASNAFLSIKIHYINEIANLCEEVGADISEVANGIGMDKRIGDKFLVAGPGYGGSCFPKDTNAIAYIARENKIDLSLVEAAIKGNNNRVKDMAQKIIKKIKNVKDPTLAVLGLAFKGGTDDCRQSPAIDIIQEVIHCFENFNKKINIICYDPKAMPQAKTLIGDKVKFADDMYSVAENADVLTILTEWSDFKELDLSKLKMKQKNIVDLRNILDGKKAKEKGFDYTCIGKII
ncbi:MAG: UDP-glucose/GDP-mannose dehydrogenase family protein [Rickettsiales bacterium]|nr:MAG: UDP-glucose/GDP-mannose dehydrogenase family protein [Rickettsiales bacterium]